MSSGSRQECRGATPLFESYRTIDECYKLTYGPRLLVRKDCGLDRTKMFHVKHFGTNAVR